MADLQTTSLPLSKKLICCGVKRHKAAERQLHSVGAEFRAILSAPLAALLQRQRRFTDNDVVSVARLALIGLTQPVNRS
jgi:hypothetical protein